MSEEKALRELLAAWPAEEPPAGFADRVLAARKRARSAPRRGLGLAAVAALVICALLWVRRPSPAHGRAAPLTRESVPIARRGIAVVEPGAALRWSVAPTGAARVEQERGDVFYRVEPGGPFVVTAGGAEITVVGTCFRVEEAMNVTGRMALSAAAGAIAGAVVVSVYEGHVQVRSPQGGVELAAGERAEIRPDAAPRAEPMAVSKTLPALLATPVAESAQASREELAARDTASRAQIAALQGRVRELEVERTTLASRIATGPIGRGGDFEPGDSPAAGLPPRDKTHDFTAGELSAMAKQCELRIDTPPLDDTWKMSPELGARLHLSDDEQAQTTAAVNGVQKSAIAYLRGLYVAATGDQAGADNLNPMTLGQELLHKSRHAEVEEARRKIAQERAGLVPPPADPNSGTIPERYFRFMAGLGDSLQAQLEPVAGAQQAGKLRDAIDGMHMTMNGCKDERDPPQR